MDAQAAGAGEPRPTRSARSPGGGRPCRSPTGAAAACGARARTGHARFQGGAPRSAAHGGMSAARRTATGGPRRLPARQSSGPGPPRYGGYRGDRRGGSATDSVEPGSRPDPFAPETGSRPGTVGNPCVPPEPRRVHMKSDRPSMERIDRSLVYSSAIAESGVAFTVTRQRDKGHGTTISCSIFRTPPPGRPPPGDRFPGHGKSRPRPLLPPAGTGPATAFPSLRRPSSPAPGPLAARAPERPPETACRPPGEAIRRVGRAFDPHRQIADQRPPHGSSC